jgi:hypothetical protein
MSADGSPTPDIELASPARRAAVELVLRRGRSYASASDSTALPTELVRSLAHRTMIELAPFSAARVEPEWRERIVDYVLGELSAEEAVTTRHHLARSEAASSWALLLVDSLPWLHENGGRPEIPAASARADGALAMPVTPSLKARALSALRLPLPAPAEPPAEILARPAISTAAPVLVALFAAVLWFFSLDEINVHAMNDLGLISVLPETVIVSMLVLSASFCVSLRRRPLNAGVLVLHVVVLVLILFGTPAIVEGEPRFTAAWRHVGVADAILRTGSVEPNIDAYFNWPGFFILTAFFTKMVGVDNALSFLDWAPVFYNLLFLGPLILLMRSSTIDPRHLWLGIWIFYLANWVGQDYFSPQATTYFLYLVILGLLATWFRVEDAGRVVTWLGRSQLVASARSRFSAAPERPAPEAPRLSPVQRMAVMALVLFLFVVTVPTHQLTPFALLTSVATVVALDLVKPRSLPLLMAVLIATFTSFMTVGYLTGHFEEVVGRVGQIQESASQNVSARVTGSPDHVFIVRLRLLVTAAIWGLALLGALRRLREGHRDFVFMGLALAPFPLFAFQPYGGEVIIRVYFFALPFMAYFAAASFFPSDRVGHSWRATGAAFLVTAALVGSFMYVRYGNERADAFSSGEVAAVERLYDIAPAGTTLVAGTGNLPWRYRDYVRHEYDLVTELTSWKNLLENPNGILGVVYQMRHVMQGYPEGAYLIFTRSQKAYSDLLGGSPPGSLSRVERAVERSPDFDLVYRNPDARIFRLSKTARGGNR